MKRILISLSIIGAVAAVVIGATGAFFSDVETSTGNTLTAGTLDLYVNGQNPLEGPVVTLEDLKPSIPQYVEKSFQVVDNPANVWLHIKDVTCDGGTLTEPEEEEQGGVEKCDFNTMTTYDLEVDGRVIIDPEWHVKLRPWKEGGVVSCWIPLGQYNPEAGTVTMVQSFHLQPEVANWAQGDIVTFAEEFLATQINAPAPEPICGPPGL